jgi:AI2M/AI1M-like HNH endonuclease
MARCPRPRSSRSGQCSRTSSLADQPAIVGIQRRECELCETGTTVTVHQVTGLKTLGEPGPGQPAWATLMARIRRKTLIVCASCHDWIHANPVAHVA